MRRPAQFTDVDHCGECREHNEELSARPRNKLLRSDLGSMGWDPISFAIPQGIAYLMPTLARYTMGPDLWKHHDWYAAQMGFHLAHGGAENRLLRFFNDEQRAAVLAMINWMIEERADDLEQSYLLDDWIKARSFWRA